MTKASQSLILVLSFFLCISPFISAQEDTAYVRTYGGPFYEEGRQIIECAAGGYTVIGTTGSDTLNNTNFYLLRLDEALNCLWSKSLGGVNVERGYSIVEDGSGNFLLCGYTNSYGEGGYDVLLYKTDNEGNILWHRTYGGPDWDFGYRIISHPEEGYVICGKTYSMGNGGSDGYLLHIDEDGEIINEWTYGGEGDDEFVDVLMDDISDFRVVSNWEDVNQKKYLRVMKLSSTGIVDWTYDKLLDEQETIGNACCKINNSLAVCGSRYDEELSRSFYFILDEFGVQSHYFTENLTYNFTYSDILSMPNRVILPGRLDGTGAGGYDAVCYFFDAVDNFIGAPTYGTDVYDGIFQSELADNNELLSVGVYNDGSGTDTQLLLIKHTAIISGDYYQDFDFGNTCFTTEIPYPTTSEHREILFVRYFDSLGRLLPVTSVSESTDAFPRFIIEETRYTDGASTIRKFLN